MSDEFIDICNDMKDLKKTRHKKWYIENSRIIKISGFGHKWLDSNCIRLDYVKANFYPHTGRWTFKGKTYSGGANKFLTWYKKLLGLK